MKKRKRHGNGAGWGGPASGWPAGGAGWGGPAKGAHPQPRRALLSAGPGRGHTSVAGAARRERNERWSEDLCEFYYAVAMNLKKPAMIRVWAATLLLNRIEGPPVAKGR
jgi:hypothetical protein